MTAVETFIYQYEGEQRKIMLHLHHMLTEEFNLTAKIRYRIPFYYQKSWICYLNPTKNSQIDFAFTRGNELSNAQGLLTFGDRKQVASVLFDCLENIPFDTLKEVLQEATLLDETVSYSVRKKK